MDYLLLLKIMAPVFTAGCAYGGAKVALNGTRDRVKHVEARTDAQDEKLSELSKSMVRVETKQDMIIDIVKEIR